MEDHGSQKPQATSLGKEMEMEMEVEGGAKPQLKNRRGCVSNLTRGVTAALACLMFLLPLLLVVAVVGSNRIPSLEWLIGVKMRGGIDGCLAPTEPTMDKLLGGLLSTKFNESSCLSRYQTALFWKQSNHTPSPYLISRLRSYESLHQRCAPTTDRYREAVAQLKFNRSAGPMDCNYVVWIPSDGLGNRIISLASAFLYALLNQKVLLIHQTVDLGDLFCEPFPNSSWVLPPDFPVQDLENMLHTPWNSRDWHSFKADAPAYLYVHLTHDGRFSDHSFFCQETQLQLRNFSWLLMRSNQYFVPALFRSSVYDDELSLLFPEPAAVFTHLVRYLLHPTNSAWGYITRYYDAYLANAQEKVGLQIRILEAARISSDEMLARVLNCSLQERLLPDTNSEQAVNSSRRSRLKTVLVTTLYSGYFEKLRNMYYEYATSTGEAISVNQPSHEEKQHSEQQNHNKKALMEMYLLSFCDGLVTSGYSTFGYVAQGLGGLKSLILLRPGKSSRACVHAVSMEPCFHAPRSYQCIAARKGKTGKELSRHVRECEDVPGGLKLVDEVGDAGE